MTQLIRYGVSNWEDPEHRNTTITDLGIMHIQYKINLDTGSYRFQPPRVLVKDHPEIEAYNKLAKIVGVFKTMTDSVTAIDRRKRR